MICQELRNTVVNWADAGVPYQHRGMMRNGCDCTGLIIGALKELGYMNGYKLREYPQDWNLHAGAGDYIRQELRRIAEPVPQDSMVPGDVITFRFGRCVAHAGVYVGGGLFVHSHVKAERCKYDRLAGSQWGKHFDGIWRIDDKKLEALSCGHRS